MKHAQSTHRYDVIVVGGGNAALCAAIAAADEGSKVLLLERAPRSERGGNSIFTDGKFRAVYNGLEDVRALVPDLTEAEIACTDFGSYSEGDFFDDMARLTQYRTDPDLCEILVRNSRDIMFWLKDNARVRFMANYGRQAYRVNGRFTFWGGTTMAAAAGGPGLVDALLGERQEQR
jgi:tricarballylate dehydrogenase